MDLIQLLDLGLAIRLSARSRHMAANLKRAGFVVACKKQSAACGWSLLNAIVQRFVSNRCVPSILNFRLLSLEAQV